VCYLLTKTGGNRAAFKFLRHLALSAFILIPLEASDLTHTADILEQYADARIDFVDATIASVSERLNIQRILTLDQRDFSILRPAHVAQFELLPPVG
jgi:predicted nucleic acid-binding protein